MGKCLIQPPAEYSSRIGHSRLPSIARDKNTRLETVPPVRSTPTFRHPSRTHGDPRRPSGAWRAVRGRVARSLESLSPLRSSDLRWDESGTVRRAYDAFAPRWNPAMPFLWLPGSYSSQSRKLRSAARPGFCSPCHRLPVIAMLPKTNIRKSVWRIFLNFLARFAIRTVLHPWFSGDIIPVIKKLPPVIGRRVSFLRGWFAQKQVKEPEYRAVPKATDARGVLVHQPDRVLLRVTDGTLLLIALNFD